MRMRSSGGLETMIQRRSVEQEYCCLIGSEFYLNKQQLVKSVTCLAAFNESLHRVQMV